MKFFTVLLFIFIIVCGDTKACSKDELNLHNLHRPLIAYIIEQTAQSPLEKPLRIELRIQFSHSFEPLPPLPEADLYLVYPVHPQSTLYVPEKEHARFLAFMKKTKSVMGSLIPAIRLFALDNAKFEYLYILFVEDLKSYFLYGKRKESLFKEVEALKERRSEEPIQ